MTQPGIDERPPSTAPEHPPFRMRGRRRRLLPDLTPPTLHELRWAARQRRLRRDAVVPQRRRRAHVSSEPGQEGAVSAPVETLVAEPLPAPVVIELPDVAAPDLEVHLAPAPEPGPVAEPEADIVELEPPQVAVYDGTPATTAMPTPLAPAPAVPSEVDGLAAPLYWRLLRLRYTRPNGWLRALFFEGAVAIAVVLVLAEAASVWTIVVLPFVVAVVVKANDILAGSLQRGGRRSNRR